MPRPKLIQFNPEPVAPVEVKNTTPEIFNSKPAKVAKPRKNLKVVAEVEHEPEPLEPTEPEPEPESEAEPEPEPEPVDPQLKPAVKSKKKTSEKQRLHMEKMRSSRARNTKTKPPPQPTVDDETKEFGNWLKNYEKFDKVLKSREEKSRKAEEAEAEKERQIEERIRKKIAEEDQQRRGGSVKPPSSDPLGSTSLAVHVPSRFLQFNQQAQPRYGSQRMFGYN